MPAENSQTLDRGLRVLACCASVPDGLTVTELASELGVGRSVIHRLVVTLVDNGLLRRGSGARYVPASGLAALGRSATRSIRAAAIPALRRISDGSAAHLIAFDGEEAALLASSDAHAEPRLAPTAELLAAALVACQSDDEAIAFVEGAVTHAIAPVRGVPGLIGAVIVLVASDTEQVLAKTLRSAEEITRALA